MTSSTPSSSTSGSGSLSSQSIPSSMDSAATIPTQDMDAVDGCSEPEPEDSSWGKLIPVGRCFTLVDLKKDTYLFGRDTTNDVVFEPSVFKENHHFQMMSKKHFELTKETNENGDAVWIKDWSFNGTMVNGVPIGRGNKREIETTAEISLASLANKAYVFLNLDASKKEQEQYPQEIRMRYNMSKFLGRGVCGEVREAFSKGEDYKKVAVKIMDKKKFSFSYPNPVGKCNGMKEVEILKKLDHPCIIKIFDAVDTPEKLYIILELMEAGELFDRIVKCKRLEESIAKLLFYQMLVAVKYLHDNGITHRDLKPENVLLNSSDDATLIKITDFGVSKFVGETSFMQTMCGTPSYLAPEVIDSHGKKPYKKECDCWSLGVILYVCLAGIAPFQERRSRTMVEQILAGAYSFPHSHWKNVSEEAKDLVRKLLTVDPEKRLSVADALKHSWLQDEKMIEKANKLMNPEGENQPKQTEMTNKRKGVSSDSDSDTAGISTKKLKQRDDTSVL